MSFILKKLVFLWMKITNSVFCVGFLFGFMTIVYIGPSFFSLLRAQAMEEGTEKKAAAITGFYTGHLAVFGSVFYMPLRLALGRSHTIIAIGVPYLWFDFFSKNFGSTTRNSLPNSSSEQVFVQNKAYQLLNFFLLPSSILGRVVYIYMFICNNKILFLIGSLVGWLIGQIVFLQIVELVLVWIRQNFFNFNSLSLRFISFIRSNNFILTLTRKFFGPEEKWIPSLTRKLVGPKQNWIPFMTLKKMRKWIPFMKKMKNWILVIKIWYPVISLIATLFSQSCIIFVIDRNLDEFGTL